MYMIEYIFCFSIGLETQLLGHNNINNNMRIFWKIAIHSTRVCRFIFKGL